MMKSMTVILACKKSNSTHSLRNSIDFWSVIENMFYFTLFLPGNESAHQFLCEYILYTVLFIAAQI